MDIRQQFDQDIDDVVKASGNENLRTELHHLIAEYFDFARKVKGAAEFGALEALIDQKDAALRNDVKFTKQVLKALDQKHQAEFRVQRAAIKLMKLDLSRELQQLKQLTPGAKELDSEMGIDLQATERLLLSFPVDLDYFWGRLAPAAQKFTTKYQLKNLVASLNTFRRWRILRKIHRHALRTLVAVVGLGYLASFLLANITKAEWFGSAPWHLGLGVACGLTWLALKEYVINPWFRRRRLDIQKQQLLSSLQQFYEAHVAAACQIALARRFVEQDKGRQGPRRAKSARVNNKKRRGDAPTETQTK